MGLKTNLYEAKKFGIMIPISAYAKIISMKHKEDGYSIAKFGIKTSREAFENAEIEYLGTEDGHFQFDKKSNPYEVAYNLAKKQVQREVEDEETGTKKVVVYTYPFYGWEDDIVE
jgi:hypothetical protein